MKIKRVTPNDIVELQKISRHIFHEAFATTTTEEDMAAYLEESFSLEKLTAEVNNPNSTFYFAVYDDNIVGYLKLNCGEAQTELKDSQALEIERIYVLKEFHGKKVGQSLYEKAREVAKRMDANYIWLGVWEQNAKAIKFYTKNGFIGFDKHIFRIGNDEQTDIMMKLQLK